MPVQKKSGEEAVGKRIVICCDGTWNTPEPRTPPSNVIKLARAISPSGFDGVHQVVYYDWGVGTYRTRLLGGMIGLGLHKDVQDAYRFIMHNHAPGDEIFLFGYSRGAYTVRSLALMLTKCGLLHQQHFDKVIEAFAIYRDRSITYAQLHDWRRKHCTEDTQAGATIKFIGVWDTIGALGNPGYWLPLPDDSRFSNTFLSGEILTARHALAIDERRRAFVPTLWTTEDGEEDDRLQQVWFSGCHADVGGGYLPQPEGLASDASLAWMAGEACQHGLYFAPDMLPDDAAQNKASSAVLHEPHHKFMYRWFLRRRMIPQYHCLHASVLERFTSNPKYRGETLMRWLEAQDGWQGAESKGRVVESRGLSAS